MKPAHAYKPSYAVRRLQDCYLVITGKQTYRIIKHKFGSKTYYKAPGSGYLSTLRDAIMYVVTGGKLF